MSAMFVLYSSADRLFLQLGCSGLDTVRADILAFYHSIFVMEHARVRLLDSAATGYQLQGLHSNTVLAAQLWAAPTSLVHTSLVHTGQTQVNLPLSTPPK